MVMSKPADSSTGWGDEFRYAIDTANWLTGGLPAQDLTAYYRFDEASGATVGEATGAGLTGTWSGTLTGQWGTGKLSGCAVFNGTDRIITINDAVPLDFTTGLTISLWLKPAATQAAFATPLGKNAAYWLEHSSVANQNQYVWFLNNSVDRQIGAYVALTANTWVHLVLTYDGTTANTYVNGVPSQSQAVTAPIATNANNLVLGNRVGFTRFYNGSMDELGLWPRALSADEVASLYNGGAGTTYGVATSRLGTGTAGASSFLRGDRVWAVPSGTGVRTPEQHGAVGNGTADDTAALTAALAALQTGETLWIAPGKIYTHTTVQTVTTSGVRIAGGGEIRATNELFSAFVISGNYVTIDNVTFTCPTTTVRSENFENQKLILNGCVGAYLHRVIVDGSASAGLFVYGASYYHVDGCIVKNTRADTFHNVKGSSYGLFTDCLAENGGDDGFACISYATGGDAGTTHHIRVHGCRVVNGQARGLSAVGGHDFEFLSCTIDGTRAAGIIAATEAAFASPSTTDVLFRDIEIRNANTVGTAIPDHGAILIDAARDGTTVDRITVRNVRTVATRAAASREISVNQAGTATCSAIVLDNIKVDGTGPATTFSATAPATAYSLFEVGKVHLGGWELLGRYVAPGGATTSGAITVVARDELMIVVGTTGLSGADTLALRFNADAGNNYWSRFITSAAGGATLANVETVTTSMARLTGVSSAAPRSITATLRNYASWEKVATVVTATSVGGSGTAGPADVWGGFQWGNATAQITSVELRSTGGAATLNAGTGIMIYGRNFSG